MKRACLFCGSQTLLHRDEAAGLVGLVGSLDALACSIRQAAVGHHSLSRQCGRTRMMSCPPTALRGLTAIAEQWGRVDAFYRDVERHHFMGERYLCLRCGARQSRPR